MLSPVALLKRRRGMDSLVLTNSLNFGPFFSKDLFCDAFFTKDNVTLIPIHRNIMAGVSSRFKEMFEGNPGRKVFVVPLVDYGTLKTIVQFIYSSSVSFEKREELEDFRTALNILKLEVPGTGVGVPSGEEPKVTGVDENFNSKPTKEMEWGKHEDLVKKMQRGDFTKEMEQEGLVKEPEQKDLLQKQPKETMVKPIHEDLVKRTQQEDLAKKSKQGDLVRKVQEEDQEEGEVTSLSTDFEERGKLTSRNSSKLTSMGRNSSSKLTSMGRNRSSKLTGTGRSSSQFLPHHNLFCNYTLLKFSNIT